MDIARSELTAEDIGVRIRAVRELAGFTVGQVSKASGVPRRDINSAEHGRRVLDTAAMRAVAGALGVSPGVLVSSSPHAAREEPLDDAAFGTPVDATTGPIPYDLPSSERRIDADTRAELEQSWVAVRGEMHEALEAATRLAMCNSSDDPVTLMRNVEFEIDKLKRKRSFQQHVARHQAELLQARAPSHGTEADA
jgi:transcriptional regulator with XRE-family HTH domain